jgi:hypothetical protein
MSPKRPIYFEQMGDLLYSARNTLDRIAIAYTGRRAGSVPRAVASVTHPEARSLPLAVLIRTRNCKPL